MADVINLDEAVRALNNQSMSRTARWFDRIGRLLGVSQEGKRDVYDIYGYPRDLGGEAGFQYMYAYAHRQGVANRLTWGIARPCWREGFSIFEDPDDEQTERLADELTLLGRRGLYRKLEQADVLNRIGRFSVLLVGVPDGLPLEQPVGPVTGNGIEALYFKAYAYDEVEVIQYETDETNPRFDLPVLYQVTRRQRSNNQKDNSPVKSFRVHYTRIVHMVENALDSEIEGTGALEPVMGRILDLEKTIGGASEAYFRNARDKTAYEIDKEFAAALLNDEAAKQKFDEGVEKFTNQWQDHTVAAGATVKNLQTAHHSPEYTVLSSLWEISAYSGIPLRVLTGQGAGQLAGSEDQLAFNQVIADRQRLVCAPWVSQVLGVLTTARMLEFDPLWKVVFPQQSPATESEQAETDNKKADTLGKVTAAVGSIGGDGITLESALQAVGLSDIEVDSLPPEGGGDV